MIFSQSGRRAGGLVAAWVPVMFAEVLAVWHRARVSVAAHCHVPEWHAVRGFVAAHRPGWHRKSTPHVALAVGYASTVVWTSPVGYSLVGAAYIVTVVCEVRQTHRVESTHVFLAVAYVATVALYPLLHAAGIGLVGAAYAFSAWSEGESRE